ncbi:MAG: putative peroxiredoxin, partial [Bacteroidota bacterium]
MSLVGKQFPDITVKAMDEMGDAFHLNVLDKAVSNKQKVLLFWYPKDFTFVCPTELHAFQAAAEEFKKRNTILIGASCDTAEVHFAWLTTAKDNGGIEGVQYPLLADSTRALSSVLGILDEEDSVTYRATYLIAEDGSVFHESVNHMPIGRNVHEYIRIIDAFTHVQKF